MGIWSNEPGLIKTCKRTENYLTRAPNQPGRAREDPSGWLLWVGFKGEVGVFSTHRAVGRKTGEGEVTKMQA